MKKSLKAIIATLFGTALLSVSCEKEAQEIAVTSISLDKSSVELVEGESVTLSATISPSTATNQKFSWSSSNEAVATVSGGAVNAIKEGSATITVKTDDGGKTATCTVKVSPKTIAVTSVSLNETALTLTVGQTASLVATVSPDNASNKSVTWKSSDETVATVDASGKLSALQAGATTISVTTQDGGKKAECQVTVEPVKPTGLSIDPATLTMTEGKTYQLKAFVSPSGTAVSDVTWTSSNIEVLTVDENGLITAKQAGKSRVHAVLNSDSSLSATCEVTVEQDKSLQGISLSSEIMEMVVGDVKTLTVIFNPSYAENQKVSWSSSDASVAHVDDGKVSALKEGSATITVTSEEGGYKASCSVTVVRKQSQKGLYYLDVNRWLCLNGEQLQGYENVYSHSGLWIDGEDIYTVTHHRDEVIIRKNNEEINHDRIQSYLETYYNSTIYFDDLVVVNDKAYMLASVRTCSYIRFVTVDLKSGKVTQSEFMPETPYSSYGFGDMTMDVAPDGTAYIFGYFKDEYKEESVRLWVISPDGQVKETIYYREGADIWSVHPSGLKLSDNGDLYVMVYTDGQKEGIRETHHLLKNGKEIATFNGKILNVGLTAKGDDYYLAMSNANDGTCTEIYKNGTLAFTVDDDKPQIMGKHTLITSKNGDLYYAVYTPNGYKLYKNQSVLYTSPDGFQSLFYME